MESFQLLRLLELMDVGYSHFANRSELRDLGVLHQRLLTSQRLGSYRKNKFRQKVS